MIPKGVKLFIWVVGLRADLTLKAPITMQQTFKNIFALSLGENKINVFK